MKKIFCIVFSIILAIGSALGIIFFKNDNFKYCKSNYSYDLIAKGFENAEDFVFDENNNIYVSLDDKIIKINNDRTTEVLFQANGITIKDIAFLNDELFYLYDDKLNSFNLKENKHTLILDSIPNFGNMSDNKMIIKENSIYLAINAATNSGVVSSEDKWAINSNLADLSPKELEVVGLKFDNEKTGAFMPYGEISKAGDKITESIIGNASIIQIDPKTKEHKLIAYGIRNVEGLDFNDNGEIFATVGGIEEKGVRPLYGDSDYIYKITEEENWYGWPDYSGGDAINSSRFRKEGKVKQNFVLKNHPTKSPKAPLYQHSDISSLSVLAIDKNGVLEAKNSLFVYDKKQNKLINFCEKGAKKEIAEFQEATIEKILIKDNSIYMLDNKEGFLFKLYKTDNKNNIQTNKTLYLILISIITILSILMTLFIKKIIKK